MTRVADVRRVVERWAAGKIDGVEIGLPEFDDRTGQWRVSLMASNRTNDPVAELRVADDRVVFSTNLALARERCAKSNGLPNQQRKRRITFRPLDSRILLGDAAVVLADYPPDSAQLVFTSPPYYNAKPEAHESASYTDYLAVLEDIFDKCSAILSEGRFLVVNTSPVLVRRPHRQAASRRIPITFDIHQILTRLGFEFIDDIIWQKPEGAGWHLGRGRRFAADRQPLQYKAVSVTENVIVYRKATSNLIDWNIRNHPDRDAVERSRIADDYERTNIWKIHPAHHRNHPAVFPDGLAERVIRYYSFINDLVLDPFAGTGTTGRVASRLDRRFMMIEKSPRYFELMLRDSDIMSTSPLVSYEYGGSSL